MRNDHGAVQTAIRVVNRWVRPLDNIFSVNRDRQPAPLFIVGVPRSGTTLTYQAITQNLNTCYFSHFMGYGYGFANIGHRLLRRYLQRPDESYESRYGRIKGILSPSEHGAFWLDWLPSSPRLGHYHDPERINPDHFKGMINTVNSIAEIMHKPLVVKCVYLSTNTGVLAKLFPAARFLLLTRDALATCRSIVTAREKLGRTSTWWSVAPPGYRALLNRPLWEQAAIQWRDINHILRRDLETYASGRYLQISYESFCSSPEAALTTISEWLRPAGFTEYSSRRLPKEFRISQARSFEGDLSARITALIAERSY